MSQLAFTVTGDIVRELAATQQVCGRPVLRRVKDRHTGAEEVVPIRCVSTRESVCAACARKALIIRMQQCAEGWHLTDEPERTPTKQLDDQDDDDQDDDETASKRVRSTRRRQDVPDLPRVEFDPRPVGQVLFVAPSGREHRPSMFLTLTLPSYGAVHANGAPRNPAHYNYRRAALDALHFSKLCARLSPTTRLTARRSSAKRCCRPASMHQISTGWPPASPCPMVRRGSSGQMCGRTTTPTSRSFSTRSASANAGASSTSTPRRRDPEPLAPPDAWTVLKKKSEVPCARTAACR